MPLLWPTHRRRQQTMEMTTNDNNNSVELNNNNGQTSQEQQITRDVSAQDDDDENSGIMMVTEESSLLLKDAPRDYDGARDTIRNFVLMSLFFSATPACALACLALATARLGSIGSWQSGVLFLSYTCSSVMGATYVVKKLGARNAMITGMAMFCFYVACFWVATTFGGAHDATVQSISAMVGAIVGGIGAGFLWTAQGAYKVLVCCCAIVLEECSFPFSSFFVYTHAPHFLFGCNNKRRVLYHGFGRTFLAIGTGLGSIHVYDGRYIRILFLGRRRCIGYHVHYSD